MKVKDAFVRATRTVLFTFVGLVGLTGVPAFNSVDDVKAKGIAWGFSAVAAVFVGVVNFANNVAEDNTAYQLPK